VNMAGPWWEALFIIVREVMWCACGHQNDDDDDDIIIITGPCEGGAL